MFTDVQFARASWPIKLMLLAVAGLFSLWDMLPVVVMRGTYKRLIDQQYVIDDATRILNDYSRLRNTYEPGDDA